MSKVFELQERVNHFIDKCKEHKLNLASLWITETGSIYADFYARKFDVTKKMVFIDDIVKDFKGYYVDSFELKENSVYSFEDRNKKYKIKVRLMPSK